MQAQGKHQSRPELPFVLGSEFAGIISHDSPIPPGYSFKPGDRVFGYAQGAYADQVRVDPRQLLPLPKNVTFDQGSGTFLPSFLLSVDQVSLGTLQESSSRGRRTMRVSLGEPVCRRVRRYSSGSCSCKLLRPARIRRVGSCYRRCWWHWHVRRADRQGCVQNSSYPTEPHHLLDANWCIWFVHQLWVQK